MENRIYTVKLCVLGDGGVGKTTLIERLSTGQFNPGTKMTIGIDFSLIRRKIITKSGEEVQVDITCWDLGGQERFRFMLSSYMNGADGAFLLYDLNRFKSANSLPSWIEIFRENARPGASLILIGSKSDLVEEYKRANVEDEILRLKKDLGINVHYIISSKTDQTIDHLLSDFAMEMVNFQYGSTTFTNSQPVEKGIKPVS